MTPDRFSRLKEMVLTVGALPEEERGAYLDSACGGDAELRREAMSLLAQREGERPPVATEGLARLLKRALDTSLAGAAGGTTRRRLPERIGPYRVVGLLGEGGMGAVYRAEQSAPIRREVALKLVRSGLDSASVLARFDAERQMLARMDHPNVATILDAGTADDGQPYFVMELVRGVPITDYCRAGRLPLRARVMLFLDVCRAVRHAHRRGVVHRDLKPSNILVTVVGGRPVVKVIDFSIAKALDAPRLETAFRTRTGQMVGTLEYMSPEQARGAVEAIDTRSDVYSLGVVLYELLSERLPIDVDELALHEAVRRIVEEPPARLRGTTAGSTTGPIDADLATIAAKCLEKDPDRRYGSALELTDEVERYLDSRPIAARPPSRAYLLRKLIGRHRVAFGVTALVFVLLAAFAVTVSVQLSIQSRERARAEAEARKAKHVVAYIQEVLLASREDRAGKDVTIREALEFAAGRVHKQLGKDPEGEAAVEETLGILDRGLGQYDRSEQHLEKALRIRRDYLGDSHPDVGATWLELANLRFFEGHTEDAESLARRAIGILERAPNRDLPRLADAFNTLGLALRQSGRLEEAAQVLRKALDALHLIAPPTEQNRYEEANASESLAGTLRRLGRYREAETLQRAALKGKTVFAEGRFDSGVATSTYNLAIILHLEGRYGQAERLFRKTREMEAGLYGEDNPYRAVTTAALADTLRAEGEYEEAEALVHEAIDLHRPAGDFIRGYLARDYAILSRILAATGRPDEAVEAAAEAVRVAREVRGESHPTTAEALAALGEAQEAAGRWQQARDTHRKALAMRGDVLPAAHPDTALSRVALARTLLHLDGMEEAAGLLSEAIASLEASVGREHPAYAEALKADALRLEAAGRASDAEVELRQAASIEAKVRRLSP